MPNLMRIGSEHADSLSEVIARTQIKYYPESIYGYSNLGTLYLMQGDLNRSLPYLLDAFEVDPNDGIIISNLSRIYFAKGEKEKVVEYLNLLLKVGTPEEQEFARQET